MIWVGRTLLLPPVTGFKYKKKIVFVEYARNSIQTQSAFYQCSAISSTPLYHDRTRNVSVFVYFSIKIENVIDILQYSLRTTGRRLRVFYFNSLSWQDGELILYFTSYSTYILQRTCWRHVQCKDRPNIVIEKWLMI